MSLSISILIAIEIWHRNFVRLCLTFLNRIHPRYHRLSMIWNKTYSRMTKMTMTVVETIQIIRPWTTLKMLRAKV